LRAGIYLRVSTDERDSSGRQKQDPENQRPALEKLCKDRAWRIVGCYVDRESGFRDKVRPEYDRMLRDAKAGKLDVVVFWSLDRFGRRGTFETLAALKSLSDHGVQFLSYQEQFLDSAGPFKDAIVGFIAAIARVESVRISDRVRAGIERSRLAGIKVGRKERNVDEELLGMMIEKKMSLREMASKLGVSRGTVANRIKKRGEEEKGAEKGE
jgi:DNA invertase Pin-like site-specific DNA recombinase